MFHRRCTFSLLICRWCASVSTWPPACTGVVNWSSWDQNQHHQTCGYRQLKWVSSIGWLGSHLRWGAWTSKGELGERAAVPLRWKESLGSGISVSGISLVCLLGTSLWWSSKHIQLGGDTRVDPEHTGGTTYCISSNMGMALDFPGGNWKAFLSIRTTGIPCTTCCHCNLTTQNEEKDYWQMDWWVVRIDSVQSTFQADRVRVYQSLFPTEAANIFFQLHIIQLTTNPLPVQYEAPAWWTLA